VLNKEVWRFVQAVKVMVLGCMERPGLGVEGTHSCSVYGRYCTLYLCYATGAAIFNTVCMIQKKATVS
jgi:hypothetical protein